MAARRFVGLAAVGAAGGGWLYWQFGHTRDAWGRLARARGGAGTPAVAAAASASSAASDDAASAPGRACRPVVGWCMRVLCCSGHVFVVLSARPVAACAWRGCAGG